MQTCAIRLLFAGMLAVLGMACATAWAAGRTTQEVIAATTAADWRDVDPASVLYLDLAGGGRVLIELAPQFAPRHVANLRTLAGAHYWDGLAIVRVQENYVVQWGDPRAGEEGARSIGTASAGLPPEFDRPAEGLPIAPLADGDVYAPRVGFAHGFPVASDPATGRAWLAHCYGMVGAGRGDTADSGSGAELYVVIGHAPRHLDRNITLVGRVLQGMEHLTTLPRGSGPLGFYQQPSQHVPIRSIRLASEVPAAERTPLQVLRTDRPLFAEYVDSRRHRREAWFLDEVGRVELCNVPLPVRRPPADRPDR